MDELRAQSAALPFPSHRQGLQDYFGSPIELSVLLRLKEVQVRTLTLILRPAAECQRRQRFLESLLR